MDLTILLHIAATVILAVVVFCQYLGTKVSESLYNFTLDRTHETKTTLYLLLDELGYATEPVQAHIKLVKKA